MLSDPRLMQKFSRNSSSITVSLTRLSLQSLVRRLLNLLIAQEEALECQAAAWHSGEQIKKVADS